MNSWHTMARSTNFLKRFILGFRGWVHSVMRVKWWEHWGRGRFTLHCIHAHSLVLCSLFRWPYAAHPLFKHCQFTLTSPKVESRPAQRTLAYAAETHSRLSCASSPQAYKPCRIGWRWRRSAGCRQRKVRATYMYHVCFWICSNCKREEKINIQCTHIHTTHLIWIISSCFRYYGMNERQQNHQSVLVCV